ncbi:hypothetical protein BPT24_150 [Tenacibaculum phage pT24]|uniref:Uncharacterized protein n=1 Tax=Tenacibaculum phage pT24 TaxID=1880590 RepID=A0A1W7GKQ5_9CAUD|nr:hypothetical protein HYP10_gp150 [Tenacibaculum phage pT24]BAX25558.1 hypothetical protein BPT24_150 [Tenacibaculum phage pT24]
MGKTTSIIEGVNNSTADACLIITYNRASVKKFEDVIRRGGMRKCIIKGAEQLADHNFARGGEKFMIDNKYKKVDIFIDELFIINQLLSNRKIYFHEYLQNLSNSVLEQSNLIIYSTPTFNFHIQEYADYIKSGYTKTDLVYYFLMPEVVESRFNNMFGRTEKDYMKHLENSGIRVIGNELFPSFLKF